RSASFRICFAAAGTMKKRPAVALLIETSNAYARGLLAGIVRYARELHPPWSIRLVEQGRGDPPPAWLRDWRGDGIVARIETPVIAEAVLATGLPVVDVSAARHVPGVPWVETDDAAIARLAAEHLLERGFRKFGFCGEPGFNWSTWREQAFVRDLAERGDSCSVFEPPADSRRASEREAMARWVAGLPKPVGVMACYDIKAQQLLDACRDAGVAVPDEVAVLGVDNDELLCELSFPPLSSVIPDSRRAGYEAARLLDRLMAGREVPAEPVLVPPLGVATRQSTDVLAIEDRDIAQAVRFIREHACDGITVGDVLRIVPLSRRAFEKRFLDRLGRTPHQEILRLKIARAEQLLAETDLSLAAIAERTGFRHAEYLSVAFKRATGRTPGRHRAACRVVGAS
ncbi:MAG TPA: DNA-binding transcriptional regulator, partial [Planctomycetaceae bacterium]